MRKLREILDEVRKLRNRRKKRVNDDLREEEEKKYFMLIVSVLYPKQSLRLTFAASEDRVSSGIPGFDERTGSGFIRGTTSAIMGPTSTAKSSFAFRYIAE
jgi:hypothetical protein